MEAFCTAHDLPCVVGYRRAVNPACSEAEAREARYAFFRKAVQDCGAAGLVLAHHREDQAETLLLHLLRGSGLKGLGAMAPESEQDGLRIYRPLLSVSRETLRQLLRQKGIPWREDSSNQCQDYLRNRLRHQVMPLLETIQPGAQVRMAETAERLREEDGYLADLAGQQLSTLDTTWIPLKMLEGVPPAMQRRLLRSWWDRVSGQEPLDASHTQDLMNLLKSPVGSQCSLSGGLQGYRGWTHLHLLGATKPIPTDFAAWEVCPKGHEQGDGKTTQEVTEGLLVQCVIRTRQTGDFIRPFGMKGSQSLQDYLVNRHVDAPFRDMVPLLAKGSEILFVAGVGAGAVPDRSQCTHLLRFPHPFPWCALKNEG